MKLTYKSAASENQETKPEGRRPVGGSRARSRAERILFSISFESRRARFILAVIILTVACLATYKASGVSH